jgi:hypothetical protein
MVFIVDPTVYWSPPGDQYTDAWLVLDEALLTR